MSSIMDKIYATLEKSEQPHKQETLYITGTNNAQTNELRDLLVELSTDQKFGNFVAKNHSLNLYDPDPNTETVSYLTARTTNQNGIEYVYTNQGRGMHGKGSFQIPFENEEGKFYVTTKNASGLEVRKEELPALFTELTVDDIVQGIEIASQNYHRQKCK